jgi:hypothetical protein
MKENHVVPGTLADLLHLYARWLLRCQLTAAIDLPPPQSDGSTAWFSARQRFPEAFYNFSRSGRMDWDVTAPAFTRSGAVGAARNVAVLLLPTVQSRLWSLDVLACGRVRGQREWAYRDPERAACCEHLFERVKRHGAA